MLMFLATEPQFVWGALPELSLNVVFFPRFALVPPPPLPTQGPHEDPKIKNGKSKNSPRSFLVLQRCLHVDQRRCHWCGSKSISCRIAAEMLFGNIFPLTFSQRRGHVCTSPVPMAIFLRRETRLLRPSPPHLHAETKLKEKETEIEGLVGNIYFINH